MDYQPHLDSYQKQKEELEVRMADPAVLSDQNALQEAGREYQRVQDVLAKGDAYTSALSQLENAKQALEENDDAELKAMAEEEISELESKIPQLERALRVTLIPPDPQDKNDALVEIRAGAGGDEAGLFAAELFRMYSQYASSKGFKVVLISESKNDQGGFKEVIFEIEGTGAYSEMKFESGVHRVQRVPETEKQGRVHTSTVTVAVLPKVEEKEFHLDLNDIDFEATTSTGAGGQSVNTTYSAIRATHKPTGVMVYCQEERSQHQNKERAIEIIRARVFAHEQEKKMKEASEQRMSQIGTGDRSEKIRTYNFPQDRLTDHRISQSWHGLPGIMGGDIGEIVTALKLASEQL